MVDLGGTVGRQFIQLFSGGLRRAGRNPVPDRRPSRFHNNPACLDFGHQICVRREAGRPAQLNSYGDAKSLLDQYARIPRRWDVWQWPEVKKAT